MLDAPRSENESRKSCMRPPAIKENWKSEEEVEKNRKTKRQRTKTGKPKRPKQISCSDTTRCTLHPEAKTRTKNEKPKPQTSTAHKQRIAYHFCQRGSKKTGSRPEFPLQLAKLRPPTPKNCVRSTEEAPNRRKRRGSNPQPVQINAPAQPQLHDHIVLAGANFLRRKACALPRLLNSYEHL